MTLYKCQYCPTMVPRSRRPKYGTEVTCEKCRRERHVQYVRDLRKSYKSNWATNGSLPQRPTARLERLCRLYLQRDELEQLADTNPADWMRLASEFAAERAPYSAARCAEMAK